MLKQLEFAALLASLPLLFPAMPAQAQAHPEGSEFRLNAYTLGSQTFPSVAMDGTGRFRAAWQTGDGWYAGIAFRRYAGSDLPEDGTEFLANAGVRGAQLEPTIAADAAGNFVVVWESSVGDDSGLEILGRGFHSGAYAWSAQDFHVNTYTSGEQYRPAVAMNDTGDFVVVWGSAPQGGNAADILARRYDSAGRALDAQEIRVSSLEPFRQMTPAVAMDESGGFVVAWTSGLSYLNGIVARRFDRSGRPLDRQEFLVNTETHSMGYPSVASNASGAFVVAWMSLDQDGSGFGVFARRYDAAGAALDPVEFQVNTYSTNSQSFPGVSMFGSGGFAVAWESGGQDGSDKGIFARTFDSRGRPAEPEEFQVNTHTTGAQSHPSVAADASGRFVVAWESYGQDGSLGSIYARRFACDDEDADGLCDADDLWLTSPRDLDTLDCSDPRGVRPTFAWNRGLYDRFRVLLSTDPTFPNRAVMTSGSALMKADSWTPPVKKWRSACNRAAAANPGAPVLWVAVYGLDQDAERTDRRRSTLSRAVEASVHY